MRKIHVGKSDSAAAVIGKVIKSPDKEVIVYIPRASKFSKSRSNFLLLKREARAAKKEVIIESVDDDVLELSASSGIRAINPFRGKRQRSVSDIVSVREAGEKNLKEEKVDNEGVDTTEEAQGVYSALGDKPKRIRRKKRDRKIKIKGLRARKAFSVGKGVGEGRIDEGEAPVDIKVESGGVSYGVRRFLVAVSITVALTVALTFILLVLPRVAIVLDFEKTNWDFIGSLTVLTDINKSAFSGDKINLRGTSFIKEKNLTKIYNASGEEFVERPARGIIVVYNAYSSERQVLVATTRFVTPDGKIYRTDNDIIVPGAKIEEGKILPSSIRVSVTSDKVGEDFNIGPIQRFRIPGFQGSPKYDGFYGVSTLPMKGGFVGKRRVATDEDIRKAKEDIIKTLESATRSELHLSLPDNIIVLDGAYRFNVTDNIVDEGASDSKTFSVTVHGHGSVVGFKEDELIDVVRERAEKVAGTSLAVRDFTVEYGEPRFNELGDSMSVAVDIESTWTQPFDELEFRSGVVGLDEPELRAFIFSVDGIISGEARFWPFWVNKVPAKKDRVIVDVQ